MAVSRNYPQKLTAVLAEAGSGEQGPLADTSNGVGSGGGRVVSRDRTQKLAVANLRGACAPSPHPIPHYASPMFSALVAWTV